LRFIFNYVTPWEEKYPCIPWMMSVTQKVWEVWTAKHGLHSDHTVAQIAYPTGASQVHVRQLSSCPLFRAAGWGQPFRYMQDVQTQICPVRPPCFMARPSPAVWPSPWVNARWLGLHLFCEVSYIASPSPAMGLAPHQVECHSNGCSRAHGHVRRMEQRPVVCHPLIPAHPIDDWAAARCTRLEGLDALGMDEAA
jgi:hypothetical protein